MNNVWYVSRNIRAHYQQFVWPWNLYQVRSTCFLWWYLWYCLYAIYCSIVNRIDRLYMPLSRNVDLRDWLFECVVSNNRRLHDTTVLHESILRMMLHSIYCSKVKSIGILYTPLSRNVDLRGCFLVCVVSNNRRLHDTTVLHESISHMMFHSINCWIIICRISNLIMCPIW